ncbi:MAG: hypothetical protein HQM09_15005 [Candidatus Riflebacteria bacterium]|nr:hypothetical protein [Candidatus Riflebacteria bacterium]
MHHELMTPWLLAQFILSFGIWVYIIKSYHNDGIEVVLGLLVGAAFLVTDLGIAALVGDINSVSPFIRSSEDILAAKRNGLISVAGLWTVYTVGIFAAFRVLVYLKNRVRGSGSGKVE